MPRINLTDEEAALIEDFRRKNTAALAFNEGIEEAIGCLKMFLESGRANGDDGPWDERFNAFVRGFKRKLSKS